MPMSLIQFHSQRLIPEGLIQSLCEPGTIHGIGKVDNSNGKSNCVYRRVLTRT
jgi:hypothetical protein